ncbi:LuxR C-terminal-related transcriptional regulator [Streptomyces sp. NPDC021098]|uniref:LuxR C-terminal-related transcriptional regulator n=1 Tax=unclassified Streptomyces TaxID=2593676 RepID=UPI003791138C
MEINLFIISDNPVSLAGLEAIIEQDEKFTLVGQAVSGPDGMRCLEKTALQPHVIILGEPSSKRSIHEYAQQIASKYRHEKSRPKMLVVSQHDDDDAIFAALRVGVSGYLAHIRSSEELLHSIRIVAKGGAAFSRTIASRLSRHFSTVQVLPELTGLSELTSRELEILELIAGGLSNQQIARRLFLAEKTVRNYVSRIFAKLEVHDRASAAMLARDAGLGTETGKVRIAKQGLTSDVA